MVDTTGYVECFHRAYGLLSSKLVNSSPCQKRLVFRSRLRGDRNSCRAEDQQQRTMRDRTLSSKFPPRSPASQFAGLVHSYHQIGEILFVTASMCLTIAFWHAGRRLGRNDSSWQLLCGSTDTDHKRRSRDHCALIAQQRQKILVECATSNFRCCDWELRGAGAVPFSGREEL